MKQPGIEHCITFHAYLTRFVVPKSIDCVVDLCEIHAVRDVGKYKLNTLHVL